MVLFENSAHEAASGGYSFVPIQADQGRNTAGGGGGRKATRSVGTGGDAAEEDEDDPELSAWTPIL